MQSQLYPVVSSQAPPLNVVATYTNDKHHATTPMSLSSGIACVAFGVVVILVSSVFITSGAIMIANAETGVYNPHPSASPAPVLPSPSHNPNPWVTKCNAECVLYITVLQCWFLMCHCLFFFTLVRHAYFAVASSSLLEERVAGAASHRCREILRKDARGVIALQRASVNSSFV
jgi:hypothetical protein